MTVPDLMVDLGRGLILRNPVIAASGTYGYGSEYGELCPARDWGAVVLKSVSLKPRTGNLPPRCVETPSGMLNSIGLANVGLEDFLAHKLTELEGEIKYGAVVVANVVAETVEEFSELCGRLSRDGRVRALEVNISCPNVARGGMQFGCDPDLSSEVVQACRANSDLPLWVKLTPNVTDVVVIARACTAAGADLLVAANTLLGMKIDIESGKPVLGNVFGGLSGPAIRPVNLRIAYQIHQALPEVVLIGCGGVEDGASAMEYLHAGCRAVEVGTATFRQPRVLYRILEDLYRLRK